MSSIDKNFTNCLFRLSLEESSQSLSNPRLTFILALLQRPPAAPGSAVVPTSFVLIDIVLVYEPLKGSK